MKVKTVPLGELIELCDERNTDNKYGLDDVRGISTGKEFIFTKANMEGVSLSSYKVVRESHFAYVADTSRRGDKISLSFNNGGGVILVSSISTVFKTKDESKLLPEYLYLFLSRPEFDRLARFNSWGSARESFDFSEFSRVTIPLPSLETQQKYVDAYKSLKTLAEQNEALIEPLEKSCTAYLADVKAKYKTVRLGDYIDLCDKRNSEGKYTLDDVNGITTAKELIPTKANMENVSLLPYKCVLPNDFAYVSDTSRRGDKISLGFNNTGKTVLVSSISTVFKSKDTSTLLPEYLYLYFKRSEFDRLTRFNSWGSARETFDFAEMQRVQIPLPPPDIQKSIVDVYHCAQEARAIAKKARETLKQMCPAIIQKAAAEG